MNNNGNNKEYNVQQETARNKSFINYKPPRDAIADLKEMPKTRQANKQATAIASFAQGTALSENQKAEGLDKYNGKMHRKQGRANSRFYEDK